MSYDELLLPNQRWSGDRAKYGYLRDKAAQGENGLSKRDMGTLRALAARMGQLPDKLLDHMYHDWCSINASDE